MSLFSWLQPCLTLTGVRSFRRKRYHGRVLASLIPPPLSSQNSRCKTLCFRQIDDNSSTGFPYKDSGNVRVGVNESPVYDAFALDWSSLGLIALGRL